MKQVSLDQLRGMARVTAVPGNRSDKRTRLHRWADLLESIGSERLTAIPFVEFYTERERGPLRADNTPMARALADPAFRAEGLAGDTFGDACAFFGISEHQAHELLCDCKYHGGMTGRAVAERVRTLAEPGWFTRLVQRFTG